MKKNPLLLFPVVLLCIAAQSVQAQFKTISESPTFEEPERGVSRIIQMKNGNTFYVHAAGKDGIDLRIYDPTHTQIVVSSIPSASEKPKGGEFLTAFEVKNNIALFISEYQNKTPVLYRYIINGTTGKLIEGKAIVTIEKYRGSEMIDAFNVQKAVVGESYAVEAYHMYDDEKDKRVEIILYGDDHVEKKRTFLATNNDNEFKFFVCMNMIMLDENRVNMFLYNGKEKYFYNERPGRMVMATVDSRKADIVYTVADLPENIKFSQCTSQYIPKTKKLYLLLLKRDDKDKYNYDNYLVKINTETNKMETSLVIDSDEKLNQKYREQFSLKDDYMAKYRDLLVNEDESYSIIYEEQINYSYTSGQSTYSTGYSGKMMLMNYNSRGQVLSGYVVPKLYTGDTYSQYKTPLYVAHGNNRYMLINDSERNNDVKKDKFVIISGISDCDAFVYNLSGNDIVPKRDYFFGSGKDAGHNLVCLGASSYDPATAVLVVIKLNKKSPTDKAVSLVWMKVE